MIGATEFYYLLTGTENLDDSLPENKFLQRFSFTDNKNRLVDKDGRLITREGKHVDDEGRFVKWTGEKDFIYVDEEGRAIDEEGEYEVEQSPFLDDEGSPIVLESEKEPDKPKRKTRKKAPEEEPVATE